MINRGMVIMALSEENKEIEREKRNSYMKDYRKTERSKEYMKKYRKENREHLNKLKSESQKRNRDSANIRSARLRAKPERKEYEKKWRLEHRKELNEYNKKKSSKNSEKFYYLVKQALSESRDALKSFGLKRQDSQKTTKKLIKLLDKAKTEIEKFKI